MDGPRPFPEVFPISRKSPDFSYFCLLCAFRSAISYNPDEVSVQGDFRIGGWTVHPRVNAMERDGETVHLEPKIMQVLVRLASDPGEVVTREQLRTAVWPDVFVGEDVLIRAVSELRRAFADDARNPRTIQTVPKVGYRLVAEISHTPEPSRNGSHSATTTPAPLPNAQPATTVLTPVLAGHPASANGRNLLIDIVAISAAVVLLAGLALWWFRPRPPQPNSFISRPLTTYPGSQLQPAISPDGSAVAFVWKKEGEQHGHIYVRQLSSEAPSGLTSGDADEFSPAWSPDGHSIAFIRHNDQQTTVVVVPDLGGSERELYVLPTNSVWDYGGITWTKDGENLIFPQKTSPEAPSELAELNLKDRSVRAITHPPAGWDGDFTPQVSPDGTRLAFVRGPQSLTRDIYVLNLPEGNPRRVTNDGHLIIGLAWTNDNHTIVFSSNRSGTVSLWRVSLRSGLPEHEPVGSDGAYAPSIARQGDRLVYSHGNAIWSIVSFEIDGRSPDGEAAILTSSEQDSSPHVSPDGTRIAFQSWRSGAQEIWTARIDGADPVQITSSGYSAGSPSWSPDGKRIAFDARPGLYAHIFLISTIGGAPKALSDGNYNDIIPSWSADGQWICFSSTRSGSWQIWKMRADGSGTAQQITKGGGMVGLEGTDRQWLYFTRSEEPGIWRVPLNGGPEVKVFHGPPVGFQGYWTVSGRNLYSLYEQNAHFTIQQIDPETGRAKTVHSLKQDPTLLAGLSATPDGKRLVFAELVRASSGLTLVDHFR